LGLLSRGTEEHTGEGPRNEQDEAGLGLAILSVQHAHSQLMSKTVLLNLSGQENFSEVDIQAEVLQKGREMDL